MSRRAGLGRRRRSLAVLFGSVAIALGVGGGSAGATSEPSPSPTATDPQAVVVVVPTPSGGGTVPSPTDVCPTLGRDQFVYRFSDEGLPPQERTIDNWTVPVRLDTARAPVRVVISLADDVSLPTGLNCRYDFSFASYDTEGGTWPTSGTPTLRDFVSGAIEANRRELTLVVDPPTCAGQLDLYRGTTRYDGVAGPLPTYPTPIPATQSIATWNGDRNCLGPGVVADLSLLAIAPCPGDTGLTWLLVNPNGRAVDVRLELLNATLTWTARVLAAPGVSPITVVVPLPAAGGQQPTLVATYLLDGEVERTSRADALPVLGADSPQFPVACTDPPPVTVDKTAVPAEGTTVSPGTSITWRVLVTNVSAGALSGVSVVDVVPAYATVTDPGSAVISADGRQLTWRVDLAAGAGIELTCTATVTATAPVGLDLVNVVVLPATGGSDTTRHPIGATTPTPGTTAPPTSGPSSGPPDSPAAGGSPPRGPLSFTGADVLGAVVGGSIAVVLGTLLVLAADRSRRRGPRTAATGSRVA